MFHFPLFRTVLNNKLNVGSNVNNINLHLFCLYWIVEVSDIYIYITLVLLLIIELIK